MPSMPPKKPMPAQARGVPVRRGAAAPTPGVPVKRGAVAPQPAAPMPPQRPFKKGGKVKGC